jgi:hypothetical protein
MNVLDPFEVAEIEMWPFFELDKRGVSAMEAAATLAHAEYTVYQKVLKASTFGAVLNEKDIPMGERIRLPPSIRGRIIPAGIYENRKHADIRIARRAGTIAALARVISERQVSKGLRRTLVVQAQRLERLARTRLEELGGETPEETPGEETGEEIGE